MMNLIFVLVLGTVFGLALRWGALHLPRERWQIFAAVPLSKMPDGRWKAANITYYGIINATAIALAMASVVFLLSSIGQSLPGLLIFFLPVLVVCVYAARLMAGLIEKRKGTLTVGGAVFIGILIGPAWAFVLDWMLKLLDKPAIALAPVFAALGIGYCLGEGLGRLSCLSFGCCYGKPVDEMPSFYRRYFGRWSVIFTGETKKAAYEGNLAGRRLVPIQLVTATILTTLALIGIFLFLNGFFRAAFAMAMVGSQGWRFLSEFLRTDDRGSGKISAYQYLALATAAYSLLLAGIAPDLASLVPVLKDGFAPFGNPLLWLMLAAIWIAVLLFLGISQVTGAEIRFFVHKKQGSLSHFSAPESSEPPQMPVS